MLEYIGPALQHLFTVENFLWINLGVFIGSVFAAVPGLTVILCVILFLPFTYKMTAIPGMMFLLGIYCAGGYGGSVSAILINTPGTPHAATTMMDGHPLSQKGRTKAALKIALWEVVFMMVMGVNSTLHAESIYAFANSRINRMRNGSVPPVTPVSPVIKLHDEEDRLKFLVSHQNDEAITEDDRVALKEQAGLAEGYKNQNAVQYDMANPYEKVRMSIENSLLSGLYFNMLA